MMNCRICGNNEDNTAYKLSEMMMGLREEFDYFECSRCKCLQIAEIPEDMSKYYSQDYYSFTEKEPSSWITRFLKLKRNEYAVFNRSVIGKFLYKKYPREDLRALSYLNSEKNDRILDVGCGKGELLRDLYRLGFEELAGIDPYNRAEIIDIGDHCRILKKNIHQVDGKWDLVMMHHVFEHLPDPDRVLESVSNLLVPGGQCLIRTPVIQSYAWEKYREDWVQLDPPRHYFIHSPQSINCLVENSDFELQETIYDSTAFQFWGSIQYEQDIPLRHETSYAMNPERSIFTSDEIRTFSDKADELNRKGRGDQAAFILQKPL